MELHAPRLLAVVDVMLTIRNALARLGYEDQLALTFGPTVYVLERNPRVLPTPVPARGYQGFWRMSPELVAAVQEQLDRIPCA